MNRAAFGLRNGSSNVQVIISCRQLFHSEDLFRLNFVIAVLNFLCNYKNKDSTAAKKKPTKANIQLQTFSIFSNCVQNFHENSE